LAGARPGLELEVSYSGDLEQLCLSRVTVYDQVL
jgi:hypothetical protein